VNERDLTEKMREKYVGELKNKRKTVEEALQEALDNTTPENAGAPNYDQFEADESKESEWI
jgi:Arc/MetJ family transcription regulator